MSDEDDEITGSEKAWGVMVGILLFPIGLLATIGLFANQSWGRWAGVIFGGVMGATGVVVLLWLLVVFIPGAGASYPFAPWFLAVAGLYAALGFLAARTFLAAIRASRSG